MTYTFTYTYKYHEVQPYKGAEVITMVVYDITAKRVNGSDTSTVTFENCQRYLRCLVVCNQILWFLVDCLI